MAIRTFSHNVRSGNKYGMLTLLVVAATVGLHVSAYAEGLDPYTPLNEQLRRTIQSIWERHTLRPSPMVEQRVREALRSIEEVEGWTDPLVGDLLSSRLRTTWKELERSRAISGLGYTEFNDEVFQTANAKFEDLLIRFAGTRSPYVGERYQAALRALDDVQALSRNARRDVPGLSSDDVLLMREKRQKLLMKEPKDREDEGISGRR